MHATCHWRAIISCQHTQDQSVTCVDARLDHPAEAVSGAAARRCMYCKAAGGATRDWRQLHKVVQHCGPIAVLRILHCTKFNPTSPTFVRTQKWFAPGQLMNITSVGVSHGLQM
jgi:hypothetical protein